MNTSISTQVALSLQSRSVRRWSGLAFVYWLAIVTMLEPGNLINSSGAGFHPHWGLEVTRLLGAGLIGAAATPILLWVATRFPLGGPAPRFRLAIQVGSVLVLAPTLILVSCILAAWSFEGRLIPAAGEVRAQMAANLLLLIFCLSLFLGLIQMWWRSATPTQQALTWPRVLTIKERGRLIVVDLSTVEWIETQGNYQALHSAEHTHLLRETSQGLQARLDPRLFVRIHRRAIVAVDFIRTVEALPNGDGIVRLKHGETLRLSRNHRSALHERLAQPRTEPPYDPSRL